jgi:hypothetical protein
MRAYNAPRVDEEFTDGRRECHQAEIAEAIPATAQPARLPAITPPADDDDSPVADLLRLAAFVPRIGEELYSRSIFPPTPI